MEMENRKNIKRDYDKESIKIINYSVLFESYLALLIASIAIPLLINNINRTFLDGNSITLSMGVVVIIWIYLLYAVLIKRPKIFKNKKNLFTFKGNIIHYHYEGLVMKKEKIDLSMYIKQVKSISYCVICELPESYGRLHYLTSWQLYRKSSIGVHIGKATLYIRYLITYIIFILPQKIWRLNRLGEPYYLLYKNLFIQFDNRNYFLVNIYSQNDLDRLTEYFQKHNILITDKIYFIPHLQNQGWFVDNEEIWTDDNKKQGE
jgi:hypothetical protein